MPSVLRTAPILPQPPPLRYPVDVKATSNDPSQRVTVNADRIVHIKGEASNNGIVPSQLTLSFEGHTLSVPLSRGMSPSETLQAIRAKLPSGYAVDPLPTFMWDDSVMFRIVKTGPSRPSTVEKIDQAFAEATRPSSPAGARVSYFELRAAVREGLKDDGRLSADEKMAIARNWASLFTGAGWMATEAAQREYARLQKRHDLPVLPVF